MARRRRPGERAGLDRSEVLFSARTLVEAHGVEQLSLRKLANALGVAPNAIYSHFPDKQALLDALLDAFIAEIPSRSDTDWRRGLVVMLGATRRLLVAHEALIQPFLSRPSTGPEARRLMN